MLVIDETGFLKQGKASEPRGNTLGSAGKITNCQIGVFAAYVSRHGHAFIDRALYLPKEWAPTIQIVWPCHRRGGAKRASEGADTEAEAGPTQSRSSRGPGHKAKGAPTQKYLALCFLRYRRASPGMLPFEEYQHHRWYLRIQRDDGDDQSVAVCDHLLGGVAPPTRRTPTFPRKAPPAPVQYWVMPGVQAGYFSANSSGTSTDVTGNNPVPWSIPLDNGLAGFHVGHA